MQGRRFWAIDQLRIESRKMLRFHRCGASVEIKGGKEPQLMRLVAIGLGDLIAEVLGPLPICFGEHFAHALHETTTGVLVQRVK